MNLIRWSRAVRALLWASPLLGFAMGTARAQRAGTIVTVAGSSPSDVFSGVVEFYSVGPDGNGGPAPRALLLGPRGLSIDATGTLFVADTGRGSVRAVTPDGIIHYFAGGGQIGYSGDGGRAVDALLLSPVAVTVDGRGNLFISDRYEYRIREVTPHRRISTAAGNGGWVTGLDCTDPDYTGDGGPALVAGLGLPSGIAADAQGSLFIATSEHIRKITPDGIITTIAGSGHTYPNCIFAGPRDPFIDDGKPGSQALLSPLGDLAVDLNGAVYIADSGQNCVLRLDPDGLIHVAAGGGATGFSGDGGPATRALLNNPEGVAVDSAGTLWIADTSNARVRKVTSDGIISTVAGSGYQNVGDLFDGGPALSAVLHAPSSVAVDARGDLLITDTHSLRIRKVFGVAAPGLLAGRPFPDGSGATFPLSGDLNSDGRIDLADALLSLRAAVGVFTPTDIQNAAGDLNHDGRLETADTIVLLRTILGVQTPLAQ